MAEVACALWYVRRNGELLGPYPGGLIKRYVLLERFDPEDEVSADGQAWRPIRDVTGLMPEVLNADLSDPEAQARLEAARRWADERRGWDRRDEKPSTPEQERRRSSDRREPEPESEVQRRRVSAWLRQADAPNRSSWSVLAGIGAMAVGLGLGVWFLSPPSPPASSPECNAPPAPDVNWRNCRKIGASLDDENLTGAQLDSSHLVGASLRGSVLVGADLSYADLAGADLRNADLRRTRLLGATLTNADLRQARLAGADLSYADLSGARVTRVQLEEVRLGNAIWINGQKCQSGSFGRCRVDAGGTAPSRGGVAPR